MCLLCVVSFKTPETPAPVRRTIPVFSHGHHLPNSERLPETDWKRALNVQDGRCPLLIKNTLIRELENVPQVCVSINSKHYIISPLNRPPQAATPGSPEASRSSCSPWTPGPPSPPSERSTCSATARRWGWYRWPTRWGTPQDTARCGSCPALPCQWSAWRGPAGRCWRCQGLCSSGRWDIPSHTQCPPEGTLWAVTPGLWGVKKQEVYLHFCEPEK